MRTVAHTVRNSAKHQEGRAYWAFVSRLTEFESSPLALTTNLNLHSTGRFSLPISQDDLAQHSLFTAPVRVTYAGGLGCWLCDAWHPIREQILRFMDTETIQSVTDRRRNRVETHKWSEVDQGAA